MKDKSKNGLYIIVAILVITSLYYNVIIYSKFEQTTLLFIGLPALLTVLMVRYSEKAKTGYGAIFRVITIFLLLSSILLGEGTACIIVAAPLFYGVGALIWVVYYFFNKDKKDKFLSIISLPLLFVVIFPAISSEDVKTYSISTEVIFDKVVTLESMNSNPDMKKELPLFFKIGFPEPVEVKGEGLSVGDMKNIYFNSSTKGMGLLSLEVLKREQNAVAFGVVNDDTHINHWLTWESINVEVVPLKCNKTKVIWTTDFKCELGPNWYFETLEVYAVNLMNQHLIKSYFNKN